MKLLLPLLLLLLSYTTGAQMKWRVTEELRETSYNHWTKRFDLRFDIEYYYSYDNERSGFIPNDNPKYYLTIENPFITNKPLEPGLQYDSSVVSVQEKSDPYYPIRRYTQEFNNNRVYLKKEYSGVNIEHKNSDSFIYDGNRVKEIRKYKDIQTVSGNQWMLYEQVVYDYDITGLVNTKTTYKYSIQADSFFLTEKRFYEYGASGELLLDSNIVQVYNTQDKQIHLYQQELIKYLYNNGIIEQILKSYTNAANVYQLREYTNYYYDTQNKLSNDSTFFYRDTTFLLENHVKYFYSASGQLAKMIKHVYYPFTLGPMYTEKYTTDFDYNSFGLLVQQLDTAINSITHAITRWSYSYEHYWPNDIKEIAKEELQATIYPNPATNMVSIKAILDGEEEVHGSITDMQGRVLQRWSDKAEASYTKTIHLSQLSSGVYFINLAACNKNVSKQFIVQ